MKKKKSSHVIKNPDSFYDGIEYDKLNELLEDGKSDEEITQELNISEDSLRKLVDDGHGGY